jgi:4-hydroxybenzoate polyprenyltransferase
MARLAEKFKAVLTLGRISNLPTIWTNVFAAMMLAMYGRELPIFRLPYKGSVDYMIEIKQYIWMLVGASLVYVSGTTLNDAFDEKYDKKHNPQRPIPSGILKTWEVWAIGIFEMATGGHVLFHFAHVQPLYLILLCCAISFYDSIHKKWAGSVWIMGSCRLFLWLAAASALASTYPGEIGDENYSSITNLVVVWSIALLLYIAGITYVARGEATGKLPLFPWPFLLLYSPFLLGFFFCISSGQWVALPILLALGLGIRTGIQKAKLKGAGIGQGVALWLALITVVDALAVTLVSPMSGYPLLLAFPLCLLTQKFFSAT